MLPVFFRSVIPAVFDTIYPSIKIYAKKISQEAKIS